MTDAMPTAPAPSGKRTSEKGIILIPWPKVVFLWPTWIVSVIAAFYLQFGGTAETAVAWAFLIALSLNLVVISFDFPRATSLLLFAVLIALGLGGALAVVNYPELLPAVRDRLMALQPEANPTFYFIFAGVMTFIYLIVLFTVRLNYWEVRPNELLHHHGILSDLKRYPTRHLRIDKEINDIFEYLLAGSGRLILHPSDERRAIVLENVFFISRKEKEITKLLGALQVQVRDKPS